MKTTALHSRVATTVFAFAQEVTLEQVQSAVADIEKLARAEIQAPDAKVAGRQLEMRS